MPMTYRSTTVVSSTEKRCPGWSMASRWSGLGAPATWPVAGLRHGPASAGSVTLGLHESAAVTRCGCAYVKAPPTANLTYAPACHVADADTRKLPYACCSVTPVKYTFSEEGSATPGPPGVGPAMYAAGLGVRSEPACDDPSASKSSE